MSTIPRVISHLSPPRMVRSVSIVPWTVQPGISYGDLIMEFHSVHALARWLVEQGGQYSIYIDSNGTLVVDKVVDGRLCSIYQEIQELEFDERVEQWQPDRTYSAGYAYASGYHD
jgi:hypothetical protein